MANEQQAKTQAGMIKGQNLPAAKAMMDGFYAAHPAVTPRYPEWCQPSATAPATAGSAAFIAPDKTTAPAASASRIVAKQYTSLNLAELTRAMQDVDDAASFLNTRRTTSDRAAIEKEKAAVLDALIQNFAREFNQPLDSSLCMAVKNALGKTWEIALAMKI